MAFYLAYGSLIESNFKMPELPEQLVRNGRQPRCTFRLLPPLTGAVREYAWFHHWTLGDGSIWISCARHAGQYVLRFPGHADFHVAAGGRTIDCAPWPGVPPETIRHHFLDQILPRILSQRDGVVLHGAAAVIDDGAVVFIGDSGRGKSTLATSLAQAGFPLLTDDSLYIADHARGLLCFPSYPGVRLWPESVSALYHRNMRLPVMVHYTHKQRVDARRGALLFATAAVPLHRIYLLAPGQLDTPNGPMVIEPLLPKEAFCEVAKSLQRFDIQDHQELKHQFDFVAKMLGVASPHRILFPHDFAMLPSLHQAILTNLRAKPAQV